MRLDNLYIIAVLLFFVACKSNSERSLSSDSSFDEIQVIPDVQIAKELLVLKPTEGKWYRDSLPFSGFAVTHHPNGALAERIGYWEGKRQGMAQKWYPDSLLQKQSFYQANRLDGEVKVWAPNGVLVVESHYINGVRHGEQKRWYPTGQLLKKTHINMGKEEGMQQAWLENGKIYVNYEAKNGRTFGLSKANLCYELEDEIAQFVE